MIVSRGFEIPGDAFDLSFRRPPLSERSHLPMIIGIGDPIYGPMVGLFFDGPSTPEELAGPPTSPRRTAIRATTSGS